MHAEEKYTLKPRPKKDDLYIEGYGKGWGEKLTFTIGVTYCVTSIAGLFLGVRNIKPAPMLTTQQKIIYSIGQCARSASDIGNRGASVALLYCLTGKIVDLLFEEEIKDYGLAARNTLTATISGALYKSTLGLRPMIFAGLLGAGIINGVTYIMNGLYDKGIIRFRVEV